jgi:hypothetical protein
MADNFTPRVKALLREHGCTFVRHGKGDHDMAQPSQRSALHD